MMFFTVNRVGYRRALESSRTHSSRLVHIRVISYTLESSRTHLSHLVHIRVMSYQTTSNVCAVPIIFQCVCLRTPCYTPTTEKSKFARRKKPLQIHFVTGFQLRTVFPIAVLITFYCFTCDLRKMYFMV